MKCCYIISIVIILHALIGASFAENKSLSQYYDKANDSFINGNFGFAAHLYSKAFEFDGQNKALLVQQGLSCFNEGILLKKEAKWIEAGSCFKLAIQSFDEAIEFDPLFPDAWWYKGVILDNLSKYEEAKLCISNAASIDKNYSYKNAYSEIGFRKDLRDSQLELSKMLLLMLLTTSFIPLIYIYYISSTPKKKIRSIGLDTNDVNLFKNVNEIISISINKISPLSNFYRNILIYSLLPVLAGSIYYFYFEKNPLHATAFLSIFVAFSAMKHLADLIPKTFRYIWINGLIISNYKSMAQNEANINNYIDFINDLQSKIHSKWQYLYTTIFAFIGYWIWSFDFRLMKTHYIDGLGLKVPLPIGFPDREFYLFIFLGIVIGYMAWRMFLIGIFISLMGKRIQLFPKADHPDGCGGLSPIGNICLWNVLITGIIAFFCTPWIILVKIEPYSIQYNNFFTPIHLTLLYCSMIWLVLAFLGPVWMVRNRLQKEKEIFLSKQINKSSNIEGIFQTQIITNQINNDILNILDYPTWPFNINILTNLAISQAIPVLTFLYSSIGNIPSIL